MKTRDKILAAARVLFNEQGVSSLSALEIATAMGISPGHLYYHFKGKAEIVAALMAAHETEIKLVLEAAIADCKGARATIETFWTHLHILVEEANDARFFYGEAGSLKDIHPSIGACARRIVTAERSALAGMLASLVRSGAIKASPEIVDGLARTLVTGIAFHALTLELEGDDAALRERVARAAAQLMLPVAALVPKRD